jgi:NADPH:quinone reductase-like Zn-dependent oxidoreductase
MAATDIPKTMRAIQWTTSKGGIEKNLHLNPSAPLPKNATNLPSNVPHTLVKVAYTTPNPVDFKIADNVPFVLSKPAIPCLDFSGWVVKTTDADLKEGQKVFGMTDLPNFGAAAEYVVVKGKGAAVPLPEGVGLKDAVRICSPLNTEGPPTDSQSQSTVGIVGLTAYQELIPHLPSSPAGSKVLINGGSGGVGTYAIQIAKALGCHVTATCSGPNVELCKSLGADEVIDYRTTNVVEHLTRSGTQYDLILDNVFASADIYWNAHHYLKPSGKFVTIAGSPSLQFLFDAIKIFFIPSWLGGGKRKFGFVTAARKAQDYVQIAKMMQDGKVKAVIEKEYALEQCGEAYERLKSGRVRGKLVVRVCGE